jgi:hypothetical protein
MRQSHESIEIKKEERKKGIGAKKKQINSGSQCVDLSSRKGILLKPFSGR